MLIDKLRCPECGKGKTDVFDSRPIEGKQIWRRRRCCGCDNRFTTCEVVVPNAIGPQDMAVSLNLGCRIADLDKQMRGRMLKILDAAELLSNSSISDKITGG